MAVEKKSIAKPEAAKTEAAPAKAEAKPAAKKAAAKKPAAKKTAAKKPAAKKPAAKTPAAKKADVKAKVVLQFGEREYTEADLVKIAQDVWKFDLGKAPADLKKIELYVKPEENKVYYVMNGESGDFNI